MAGEIATAFVSLIPQLEGGKKRIAAELGGAGDSGGKTAGKKFGAGILGGIGRLAGPVGIALGALGVGKFFTDAFGEAEDARKVGALTASAIKATGGAAKISAPQVAALAGRLSEKAGVDDEVIQTGANLLLTFKNVRNEAGKGNDVFNQATQAAVNLSAAGFGSIDSASKMLGKALNDPIKGISALSRAGVTFTEGQKKQIEAMVESGDVLGAQKIIMKEVESQVGGAAEAQASAADKAKVAWGNFKEEIGTALLPTIDMLLSKFSSALPKVLKIGRDVAKVLGPIFATIGPIISKVASTIQGAFSGGGGGAGFLTDLGAAFETVKPAIMGFVSAVLPVLQKFAGQIMAVLGPGLASVGRIIKNDVAPAFAAFLTAAKPVAVFLLNIIGGAVVGALKGVVQVVQGVLKVLSGVLNVFAGIFTGDWSRVWKGVKQIATGVWTALKGAFKIFINVGIGKAFSLGAKLIGRIGSKLWTALKGIFTRGANAVKQTNQAMINAVVGFFRSLPGKAGRALSKLASAIVRPHVVAFNQAKSAITRGISAAIGFIRGIPGKARNALGNLGSVLRRAGASLIEGFARGIRDAIGRVTGAVGDVMSAARRLIPSSPAKEGPFSGKGWTLYSGRSTGEAFATGMASQQGLVANASKTLMGAASFSGGLASDSSLANPGMGSLRVFIGDRELTDIVRVEVDESNRGVRRRVMAGVGGNY